MAALAIGAWDLDIASAEVLRHDVATNRARAKIYGPEPGGSRYAAQ